MFFFPSFIFLSIAMSKASPQVSLDIYGCSIVKFPVAKFLSRPMTEALHISIQNVLMAVRRL